LHEWLSLSAVDELHNAWMCSKRAIVSLFFALSTFAEIGISSENILTNCCAVIILFSAFAERWLLDEKHRHRKTGGYRDQVLLGRSSLHTGEENPAKQADRENGGRPPDRVSDWRWPASPNRRGSEGEWPTEIGEGSRKPPGSPAK
jgi:hypothetical protein